MKIVGSFLRFTLVMIGSLFLAIGITIVNACKSVAQSMNGYAAPRTQSPVGTNSVETTSTKPTRVILNLKDGTKITGEALVGSVTLQAASGRMDVSLTQVRRLIFNNDTGTVAALLKEGGILSGKLVQSKFEIATEAGKVSIKSDRIDFIENPAIAIGVKPEGKTVDELMKQLASEVPTENQRAVEGLVAKGQEAVLKLKEALQKSSISPHHARIVQVLATLGWYVTRDSKVEKMSESKEFQEMMRKRLPEMQAE
jgi:hypothetical protein